MLADHDRLYGPEDATPQLVWSRTTQSALIILWPGQAGGPEASFAQPRLGELFAVDADLKRTAKSVIDRILHLRDSL